MRNEQDIIEAFVRHTLAVCDRLLIMDHGSTDATPLILKSLQDEGLALEVIRDDTVGRLQAVFMGRLAQRAAQELQADWILFLDADEFLQGDVRRSLAERSAVGGVQYLQCWLVNYVVRPEDDPGELNPVKRIRHRTIDCPDSDKDRRTCKSIVTGDLVRQEGFAVGSGSHRVTLKGEEPPFEIISGIWLGHFSLRAPCQYGSKLVSVMFQRYCRRAKQAGNADFYQSDYARLRESYTRFARNFVDVKLAWWSRTIMGIDCCPIDYYGGELRYTPTCSDVDQFIRNTLNLGLHIAQMNTSTPTEMEEAAMVFIALKDGKETLQKQSMEANVGAARELRFHTGNLKDRSKLVLELNSGPGMLEIERVVMRFEDGSQQEFCERTLGDLITVERDGMAARSGPIQRIFTCIPSLVLNIWGNAHRATELQVSLRFINRPQMTSMAVGDYSGIQWFDRQLKMREQDPAPVRTPLNTIFSLTQLEQTCVAIGEGWRGLRFSGLRLSKNRGRLGLRFGAALKGRIKLRFEAKLKTGKDQPVVGDGKIRIFAEDAPVAVWQFKKKKRQWFTIDIAADPVGRRGVDLVFEIEEGTVDFWIQRVKVESLHERGWIVGVMRQMLGFLGRKLASKEKRMSIAPGEVLRFGARENGIGIAAMGWAPPQENGSRAEARLAVLRFSLQSPRPESLRVKLLLVGGDGAGVVRLAWEHIDLISFWLDAHTPQSVEIDLPPSAAKREQIFLLFRSNEKSIGFELREMVLQAGA